MLSFGLSFLLATVPLEIAASTPSTHQHGDTTHKEIGANDLKSLYDENKEMIVLDARSKPYFDGTLLPRAQWMPADAVSEADIQAAIPSKELLIVVYCAGPECPASGWLVDKLTAMGYKNVVEYPDGICDWIQRGFPTNKA